MQVAIQFVSEPFLFVYLAMCWKTTKRQRLTFPPFSPVLLSPATQKVHIEALFPTDFTGALDSFCKDGAGGSDVVLYYLNGITAWIMVPVCFII
jgi:hypothetical protein